MKKNLGYKQVFLAELSQTHPTAIPEEWDVKKLKQIADVNPEQITEEYNQKEILYVDIASIDNFLIQKFEKYKLNERPSRSQRIIRKNDIIISTVRPYLKAFAKVIDDKPNMICSTGFSVIRVKNQEDVELIFNYVKGFHFETYITRLMEGMAYPAITSNVVRNSLIPYSQNKIEREYIGQILSTVNNLIESYNKVIESTKKLKKGLMQQLLTKGIGHNKFKKIKWAFGEYVEIPNDWNISTLGECCSQIQDMDHKMPKKLKTGIPFLSISHIINGDQIDFSEPEYISDDDYSKFLKKIQPSKNDLLYSRVGTIGEARIIRDEKKFAFTYNVVLIKTGETLEPLFLKFMLNFDLIKNRAKSLAPLGVYAFLGLGDIRKIPFILPSLKEQQKIVSILSEVDSRIEELDKTKSYLRSLKKGLMQKLLTGQIRVNSE